MGTKPCKPVVLYEEVQELLKALDFAHLQQVFLTVAGSRSFEARISKDQFSAWVRTADADACLQHEHGRCLSSVISQVSVVRAQSARTYTDAGRAVLDRLFEVLDADSSKSLSFKVGVALWVWLGGLISFTAAADVWTGIHARGVCFLRWHTRAEAEACVTPSHSVA